MSSNAVSVDYSTPCFNKLVPRHKQFVLHYVERFDAREAAKPLYTANTYKDKAKEVLERGDIQLAITEILDQKRAVVEQAREAVIERLVIQATVTLLDLAIYDEDIKKYRQRSPNEIEPRFLSCLGMTTPTREGHVSFNQGSADNAKKLLQQYMLWDKQVRDDLPAITFDFSGVKAVEYSR
jgi:hypothetical protein